MCATVCLTTCQLKDIWVVSNLVIMKKAAINICVQNFLYEHFVEIIFTSAIARQSHV